MTYAILNKDTGNYFAGFDSNGAALWGAVTDAWQNRLSNREPVGGAA